MNPGLFVPLCEWLGVETVGAYAGFIMLVLLASVPLTAHATATMGLRPLKVVAVFLAQFYVGGVSSRLMFFLTATRPGAVANQVDQVGWGGFLGSVLASPWGDGQVYYGGLLGGVATAVLVTRLLSGRDWPSQMLRMLDVQAFPLVLISALGRMGCYFQGCCFGHVDRHLGVVFPPHSAAAAELMQRGGMNHAFQSTPPLIPTQLMEVASSSALLVFMLWRLGPAQRLKPGCFIWHALVWYGVFRFNIEWFRDDNRGGAGGFSTSQWIAGVMVLALLGARFRLQGGWRNQSQAPVPPPASTQPRVPRVAAGVTALGFSLLAPLGFGWLTRHDVLPGGVWTDTLVLGGAVVGMCMWLVWKRGGTLEELGLGLHALREAWAAFAAATLMLTAGLLWLAAWRTLHVTPLPPAFLTVRAPPGTAFGVFYALVSCPAQELFYRGLLFAVLKRLGLGPWWLTVPLTALSYAGLHLLFSGIPAVVPITFALGLLWGALYHRFPSVWAAAGSHAVLGLMAMRAGVA